MEDGSREAVRDTSMMGRQKNTGRRLSYHLLSLNQDDTLPCLLLTSRKRDLVVIIIHEQAPSNTATVPNISGH